MFANLPDLSEVKAQVDRIENAVLATQAAVQALTAQMNDVHLVFQGLSQVLPMPTPGASNLLLG
jgi:hypothetical protein